MYVSNVTCHAANDILMAENKNCLQRLFFQFNKACHRHNKEMTEENTKLREDSPLNQLNKN